MLSVRRGVEPPHRAAAACDDKRHLPNEHAARVWAQDWIRAGRSDRPVLFVYACRFCGDWHLTKQHDDPAAAGVTERDLYARPQP